MLKRIINEDRRDYLVQAILITIAISGIISIAMVMPNVLQLIKLIKKIWHKSQNQQKSYVNRKIKDLIGKKLITVSKKGELSLTLLGEKILNKKTSIEKNKFQKTRWDKKWRVVIFDIKENQRKKRDYFRYGLAEAGFIKLQNSVWISPYQNDDFIELLKTDLSLKSEVVYFEALKISEEEKVKKIFGL